MWIVLDKSNTIVLGSFSTRAQAYNYNRQVKWLNPDKKYKVERL